MQPPGMGNLRNDNIFNSSRNSIDSSSSNSTSRTLLSTPTSSRNGSITSFADSSRKSSINSSCTSFADSSRKSSIWSNSSNISSRGLLNSSISSASSASSTSSGDHNDANSSNLVSRVFVSRVNRTMSLDDSSISEMPIHNHLLQVPIVLSARKHSLTVPFVPTHQSNIVHSKSGSLYIDNQSINGSNMNPGKDEKVLLGNGLHNPIWITPPTENDSCSNRKVYQAEDTKWRRENYPDFTEAAAYRTPRPPKKWYNCKCTLIPVLTCILSLFVLLLILGFVVYNETVIKKLPVRIHYKL
ncbi:unnamed protein product [Meganyctiphanes norvegica]|uniref:Uncharacterized protein n=1 Tax=Meganyctiphanes norvegica TaxID=48144 RepID=A0AAV2R903_MEGNR